MTFVPSTNKKQNIIKHQLESYKTIFFLEPSEEESTTYNKQIKCDIKNWQIYMLAISLGYPIE